jgi:CDP-diacylglycerol--glycerol-3-phosphate 3-phosphatidyltransferase
MSLATSFRNDWHNAPNMICWVRLLLSWSPGVLVLVWRTSDAVWWWAVSLFLFIAATDAVDGYVARRFKQTSEFGAFFDPLVDKVLISLTLIAFSIVLTPWLWVPTLIIIIREMTVTWWRLHGKLSTAGLSGKLKMWAQTVMVVVLLAPLRGSRFSFIKSSRRHKKSRHTLYDGSFVMTWSNCYRPEPLAVVLPELFTELFELSVLVVVTGAEVLLVLFVLFVFVVTGALVFVELFELSVLVVVVCALTGELPLFWLRLLVLPLSLTFDVFVVTAVLVVVLVLFVLFVSLELPELLVLPLFETGA